MTIPKVVKKVCGYYLAGHEVGALLLFNSKYYMVSNNTRARIFIGNLGR